MYERFVAGAKELLDPNSITIAVTHFYGVDCITKHFGANCYDLGYCSLTLANWDTSGEWKL
jgi:hypothetical protein